MEDLSADDDILSDILLDTLEFEPAISTHKMNPNYRGQRFDRGTVSQMVRKRVVVERDIGAAIEDLGKLSVVHKYLHNKTQRQMAGFHAHARRYLETYLPDSGVEFALTTRYKRVMMERLLTSKAASVSAGPAAHVSDKPGESSSAAAKAAAATATASATVDAKVKEKGKGRQSLDRAATSIGAAPAASEKADLCVLAMLDFKPGDLIAHCKGGFKDLTKSEDEALREEAVSSREKRREAEYKGVLGPGRDFSVISSSRKGCSQLLLGPARFVNHDCNPNTEFYRMGAQMTFKVIRPIAHNEEITTFYGENYFEWANSECMCATCELKGVGAFADKGVAPHIEDVDAAGNEDDRDGASEANGDGRRRLPQRVGRTSGPGGSSMPSPSPIPSTSLQGSGAPSEDGSSENKTRRDILANMKLAQHGPSDDRSDPYAEGAGPQCRCLTCGATFWAPEKWWTPDECPRCERHYKIFKADWPERVPTEGLLASKGSSKGKFHASLDKENDRAPQTRMPDPLPSAYKATPAAKKRARSAKASSTGIPFGVVDGGSPSVPASPITLTPLRDTAVSGKEASGAKAKAIDASPRTTQAAAAHPHAKGSRSHDVVGVSPSLPASSQAPQQAAKKVGATLAAAGLPKGSPSIPLRQDSDDSDLTQESDSESDRDRRPATRATSVILSASARSSSSVSPGPTGPKMLGKHAKTDVLAQYWGAPLKDKRSRRKSSSHNAPTLLGIRKAVTAASPGEARKSATPPRQANASDSDEVASVAAMRAVKKRALQSTPDQEEEEEEAKAAPIRPPASGALNHRKTASMDDLSALVHAQVPITVPPQARVSLDQSTEQLPRPQPLDSPGKVSAPAGERRPSHGTPRAAIPGLATTGTERTSESNLALFWSAGVEGGRTRRQVPREPQTLTTSQTPAKRSRPGSEASRSRTPEVNRVRGRAQKGRISDSPAEGSTPTAAAANKSADLQGNVRAEEDMDVDSEDNDESEDDCRLIKGSDGRRTSGLADSDLDLAATNGFPTAKTPLLPAATLMRPPPFVRPDLLAAARANSPLAGPPPSGLRAGAPGQPIRKNLRWGSGKTSLSRPMGSVSPLARPFPRPNGSPTQASSRPAMETARVLQFPARDTPLQPPGLAESANGTSPLMASVSASASAPPDLNVTSSLEGLQRPMMGAPQPSNGAPALGLLKEEFRIDALPSDVVEPQEKGPVAPQSRSENGHHADLARSTGTTSPGTPPLHPTTSGSSTAVLKVERAAPSAEELARIDARTPPNSVSTHREAATSATGQAGDQSQPSLPASDAALVKPAPASPDVKGQVPTAVMSARTSTQSSPSSNELSLQRRVSGRARKAPEMAAGQISYKGSLVKLAAQRAKGSKKVDLPTSRSATSTPQRSPPSSKDQQPAFPSGPARTDDRTPEAALYAPVHNSDPGFAAGKAQNGLSPARVLHAALADPHHDDGDGMSRPQGAALTSTALIPGDTKPDQSVTHNVTSKHLASHASLDSLHVERN